MMEAFSLEQAIAKGRLRTWHCNFFPVPGGDGG